MIVSHIAIHI